MAKRKQSRKQRKQVKRTTRHFQLRVDHPLDSHVREVLDYAKSQRREVTLIRDSIALWWALENNNLEALFEKFPQYRAKLSGDSGQGGGGVTNETLQSFMEMLQAQQLTGGYLMQSNVIKDDRAEIEYLKTLKAAAPPKAEVKQAVSKITADEIANNMLNMLSMFD